VDSKVRDKIGRPGATLVPPIGPDRARPRKFFRLSPINARRWRNFKSNKRGYWSLWIFLILFFVSLFAELIANDKPYLVLYDGEIYSPVLTAYPETMFGGEFETEADYRDPFVTNLIKEKGGSIFWPPIHYSYNTINLNLPVPAPAPPSGENWLGTDDQGRDVVARAIYGFRLSVLFGLVLTIISSVIGVSAGAVQGYFGGWVDLLFQRFIEVWTSIPSLYLLIIIAAIIEPNFWILLGILLLFSWVALVGVVRAEFLRGRNLEYIRAARALGLSNAKIMFKHLLPNAMVATLTFMPFILNGSISTLTSLDFLGFGLPPGSPSLGEMLAQGKANLQAPWLGITAFMVIAVMLSLLIFVGEAVRDSLDPRKTFVAPNTAEPVPVEVLERTADTSGPVLHKPSRKTKKPPDALLRVKNLSVDFTSDGVVTHAVKNASFDIMPGETVALVGESGSGKTVSALSVMRLLPYPAASHPSGEVIYGGDDLLHMEEQQLRGIRGNQISMIFQEPMSSLNPLHSIEKQVGEILKLHRGLSDTAARARVLELLDKVGIEDPQERLSSYPHQLSGGQRQRVMIAMALANEPDLLIADEPTTALDVTIQAQILELLFELQKEFNMAMLLITHDLAIVRKMANRISVMNEGQIVEQGETEQIFKSPKHPYTKHLLGAEPKGDPPRANEKARAVIETDNLKVWFPVKRGLLKRTVSHIKAVDGISLKLRAGQTLGVVGESGSGKTTLGLALLRLISSEGRIVYLGKSIEEFDYKNMRPLRREMQAVFQDPFGSLSPRLSVGQIIEEGLLIQSPEMSFKERRARVARALSEVDLDPTHQDRYPHEFSGGQRQRIAIARAMVLQPKFVMLDEPTSALDMSVQAQIVDLLRELQDKHELAYLFISHDLKVVRALANSVIVMRNGKVVEQGTSKQIFSSPRTDYTKALMAAAFDLETAHQDAVSR
jgi:ABC-type microcin C transport system duplicated ATPase subunit YejF/ABC-type microcin C transport system permease subunit YejE